MEAYVVQLGVNYEGRTVLGVFATEAEAVQFAEKCMAGDEYADSYTVTKWCGSVRGQQLRWESNYTDTWTRVA